MRGAGLAFQSIRACFNASAPLTSSSAWWCSITSCFAGDYAHHTFHHEPASSSSINSTAWSFNPVRYMGGRTHKLSLKRANNKASWAAVQPFLKQQQATQQSSIVEKQHRPEPILTAIPELPKIQEPAQCRRIGKLTAPYAITQQAAFAVVETGGSQFKVTTDDVIYHNKIANVMINDVVELGKVLLIGTQQETNIGRPFIPGASVIAAVEETFKDAKVHVFKKKKRKGYSKLKGYRAQLTALRILEIRAPGQQLPTISSSAQQRITLPAAQIRKLGAGSKPQAANAGPQPQQQQVGRQQQQQQAVETPQQQQQAVETPQQQQLAADTAQQQQQQAADTPQQQQQQAAETLQQQQQGPSR